MNRFFSKFPWLRPLGCGLLVCALVLSICLPLLGMRAAEPENPILSAEPQEITVLQAGKAPGHSGSGDGLNASGSGANGDTESDLTGDHEQPDPNEADSESGQSTEPETIPQEQPSQPDYSDLDIGTNTDSNSGSDGSEAGDTGEADETLPLPDLDLGAALTWYKYGAQPASIACAPGETVGKHIPLAQLDNGVLSYDLRLTGLNAPDAKITGASFAPGNGVPSPIESSGSVVMTLPDGAEFQNYVFTLQAHVSRNDQNGDPVEADVEFTFLLRLESGLDLDLRLTWQTTSSPAEATCGANNTTTRTIKSDALTDGLFQYSFDFLGESARTAEFLSADYRAGDGETGALSQSGILQMSPADGQDKETYFFSITARASGQTVRYSFVLTYEDGLDLQLKFSWLDRSSTRHDTLCAANGGASLTIKHNQLNDGLLRYQLALTGRSADKAAITSATLDGTTTPNPDGSIQLQSAAGGASYTLVVTAESGGKTVTFKLLLRYQSDVSLKMTYSVRENDTDQPRQLTCENGRTATAGVIRDDQLTDDLLTYQFSIEGEEASDVTITSVEFLNGRGRSDSLSASGTAALTLGRNDKTTGNNTFTVTAKQGDTTYQFTFVLPYKHQGEQSVQIEVNNYRDGQEFPVSADGGLDLRPSIRAWRENADGTTSIIYASGLNGSQITVTLYRLENGSRVQTFSPESSTGQGSDGSQEYVFHPTIPANAPGDDFEFELYIYAEDEEGNWGEETLTLHAKRSEKGQKTGKTAQIYIDLGVLGLEPYGPISYDILSGEPLSYVIEKAILGQTVPAPFDKPCATLPGEWTGRTQGSLDSGYYLASLNNGQLNAGANALSTDQLQNGWSTFSDDQAAFDRIDNYFGAGTNLARLWRCLYKNRVPLSRSDPNRDGSLGEFNFTTSSGWMYTTGQTTVYPGHSLSDEYFTSSGDDVLILRYTLACGWDVGGGMGDTGNNGAGYCITWESGGWVDHGHNYPAEPDKDGSFVCTSCGYVATTSCTHSAPHEWRVTDDGEHHMEYCTSCNQPVTGVEESHERSFVDNADGQTHTVKCSKCPYVFEPQSPHRWPTDEELAQKATCTESVTLTLECKDGCGAAKEVTIPPAGHQTGSSWDSTAAGHRAYCTRCEQPVGDYTPHNWVYDSQYHELYCSVCAYTHGEYPDGCPGELTGTPNADGATHTISCPLCGASANGGPHDQNGENGACSVCGYTSEPEIPEHNCAEHVQNAIDNGDGTHTGTCSICSNSVTQTHTYENGICIYCYAPQPSEPTEPETPTGKEEGESQDE